MRRNKSINSEKLEYMIQVIKSEFDEEFYIQQAKNINASDAVTHYILKGSKKKLDPCSWFSSEFYLDEHKDVANESVEPFFHYLTVGKKEERAIKPSKKAHSIGKVTENGKSVQPISTQYGLSPDENYIATVIAPEFEEEFYQESYNVDELPLVHYIKKGWREGKDPSPWFSSKYYLDSNEDVKRAGVNPFFHFLTTGRSENRPFTSSGITKQKEIFAKIKKRVAREFDEDFYRTRYNISANIPALEHFLDSSPSDLLDPCPWFSSKQYLALNDDIEHLTFPAFCHFLSFGVVENREFFEGMDTSHEKKIPLSPIQSLEKFHSSGLKSIADVIRSESSSANLSKNWINWTRKLQTTNEPPEFVRAHLELSINFKNGKDGVLLGWLVKEGAPIIWIEDEANNVWFFDETNSKFDIKRSDVFEAFSQSEFALSTDRLGFAFRLPDCAASGALTMKCLSRSGVHVLGHSELEKGGFDPVNVAKWMFGISTPIAELSARFAEFDIPVIENIIAAQRAVQHDMTHVVKEYGPQVTSPLVSIIIPLYGRVDFLESQILCFELDDFVKEQCEIIYVIDDPRIEAQVSELSEATRRLYSVPFKTVFGGANRGFSGANNLGAEYARAEYLLFLNSDVFPSQPGWLKTMKQVHEANSDIGIVAPRLLFADGSIQHAGISFEYRSDLNIWINHHPQMGLSPEFDRNKDIAELPAVTGACMLMSKADFEKVEGWDTGYLIGDFEDSDLCLKMRKIGKKSVYIPSVELTHLERQSFSLTGGDDFRTKVVIYNATRHHERWKNLIKNHTR